MFSFLNDKTPVNYEELPQPYGHLHSFRPNIIKNVMFNHKNTSIKSILNPALNLHTRDHHFCFFLFIQEYIPIRVAMLSFFSNHLQKPAPRFYSLPRYLMLIGVLCEQQ